MSNGALCNGAAHDRLAETRNHLLALLLALLGRAGHENSPRLAAKLANRSESKVKRLLEVLTQGYKVL